MESLRFPRILKNGEEDEINAADFVVAKDSIWIVTHSGCLQLGLVTKVLYHSLTLVTRLDLGSP